jgi:ADP-ribosylglycohydrolase
MRVSPLGIWGAAHDPAAVASAARRDAELSHPNPVCQAASAVYVVSLAAAIREGLTPEQTWSRAMEWLHKEHAEPGVLAAVKAAHHHPPPDYRSQHGWVLIALHDAFFQLLHAATLKDALLDTVRRGGDVDTNAAICGALLGAIHGREAVPERWRAMVLSCRPIPGPPGVRHPRPALFWPTDALQLAERLLTSGG